MQFFDKVLKSVVVAGFAATFAFSVGLVAQPNAAYAQGSGENFDIDETCDSNGLCSEGGGILTGIDRLTYSYEATLHQVISGAFDGVGDTFIEKGVVSYTGYIDDDGAPVVPTSLNNDYQLYAVFTATGTAALTGVDEITVTFDTFTIDIYISDETDFGFLLAEDPGGTNADATDDDPIILNTGDDNLLASASLIATGDAEVDGFGISGGDFAVIVTDFGLSLFGEDFFINPSNPFYSISQFDGNNSLFGTQACPNNLNEGVADDGNLPTDTFTASFTTCIDGAGSQFFAVPEPSTLGMFGIGLIAFGFVMTRRQRRSLAFTG